MNDDQVLLRPRLEALERAFAVLTNRLGQLSNRLAVVEHQLDEVVGLEIQHIKDTLTVLADMLAALTRLVAPEPERDIDE